MRRHSMGATPTSPIGHVDSIGHVECHTLEPETNANSLCRRSFWKNKKNKENEPPVSASSNKDSPPFSRRRGSIGRIFRRNKMSSSSPEGEIDETAVSVQDNTSVYSAMSVITFDDNEIDGIIKSIGSSTPLAWSPSSQFRPKQGNETGRRRSSMQ